MDQRKGDIFDIRHPGFQRVDPFGAGGVLCRRYKYKRGMLVNLHLTVIRIPWQILLVGGFNPFEKYAGQIGSFPQVGMKIKNIKNHQPDCI